MPSASIPVRDPLTRGRFRLQRRRCWSGAVDQVPQRLAVRLERDVTWQVVQWNEARLDRVVPRAQPAARPLGGVQDQHRADARIVEAGIDAEQVADAAADAGLLAQLA